MFKVSTMDKDEALRTGKEFLSKEFYKIINGLRVIKIHRCEYCRVIIKEYTEWDNKQKYCSKWCLQQDKYYDAQKKKQNKSTEIIKNNNI